MNLMSEEECEDAIYLLFQHGDYSWVNSDIKFDSFEQLELRAWHNLCSVITKLHSLRGSAVLLNALVVRDGILESKLTFGSEEANYVADRLTVKLKPERWKLTHWVEFMDKGYTPMKKLQLLNTNSIEKYVAKPVHRWSPAEVAPNLLEHFRKCIVETRRKFMESTEPFTPRHDSRMPKFAHRMHNNARYYNDIKEVVYRFMNFRAAYPYANETYLYYFDTVVSIKNAQVIVDHTLIDELFDRYEVRIGGGNEGVDYKNEKPVQGPAKAVPGVGTPVNSKQKPSVESKKDETKPVNNNAKPVNNKPVNNNNKPVQNKPPKYAPVNKTEEVQIPDILQPVRVTNAPAKKKQPASSNAKKAPIPDSIQGNYSHYKLFMTNGNSDAWVDARGLGEFVYPNSSSGWCGFDALWQALTLHFPSFNGERPRIYREFISFWLNLAGVLERVPDFTSGLLAREYWLGDHAVVNGLHILGLKGGVVIPHVNEAGKACLVKYLKTDNPSKSFKGPVWMLLHSQHYELVKENFSRFSDDMEAQEIIPDSRFCIISRNSKRICNLGWTLSEECQLLVIKWLTHANIYSKVQRKYQLALLNCYSFNMDGVRKIFDPCMIAEPEYADLFPGEQTLWENKENRKVILTAAAEAKTRGLKPVANIPDFFLDWDMEPEEVQNIAEAKVVATKNNEGEVVDYELQPKTIGESIASLLTSGRKCSKKVVEKVDANGDEVYYDDREIEGRLAFETEHIGKAIESSQIIIDFRSQMEVLTEKMKAIENPESLISEYLKRAEHTRKELEETTEMLQLRITEECKQVTQLQKDLKDEWKEEFNKIGEVAVLKEELEETVEERDKHAVKIKELEMINKDLVLRQQKTLDALNAALAHTNRSHWIVRFVRWLKNILNPFKEAKGGIDINVSDFFPYAYNKTKQAGKGIYRGSVKATKKCVEVTPNPKQVYQAVKKVTPNLTQIKTGCTASWSTLGGFYGWVKDRDMNVKVGLLKVKMEDVRLGLDLHIGANKIGYKAEGTLVTDSWGGHFKDKYAFKQNESDAIAGVYVNPGEATVKLHKTSVQTNVSKNVGFALLGREVSFRAQSQSIFWWKNKALSSAMRHDKFSSKFIRNSFRDDIENFYNNMTDYGTTGGGKVSLISSLLSTVCTRVYLNNMINEAVTFVKPLNYIKYPRAGLFDDIKPLPFSMDNLVNERKFDPFCNSWIIKGKDGRYSMSGLWNIGTTTLSTLDAVNAITGYTNSAPLLAMRGRVLVQNPCFCVAEHTWWRTRNVSFWTKLVNLCIVSIIKTESIPLVLLNLPIYWCPQFALPYAFTALMLSSAAPLCKYLYILLNHTKMNQKHVVSLSLMNEMILPSPAMANAVADSHNKIAASLQTKVTIMANNIQVTPLGNQMLTTLVRNGYEVNYVASSIAYLMARYHSVDLVHSVSVMKA